MKAEGTQSWVFLCLFLLGGDGRMKKILIIDDDIEICKQIKYNLQNETTEVYYAESVKDALLFLMKNDCCLIILEISLSEMDGAELIQSIRKRSTMPVLVLSYDGSIRHMKKAYDSGADDFLVKPFVTEECLLRSQALIRRFTELNPDSHRSYTIVEFDDLAINEEYRKVFLCGEEVDLTGKEYSILALLISNPDRVYTYEQIFEHAWNDSYAYAVRGSFQFPHCSLKNTAVKRSYPMTKIR